MTTEISEHEEIHAFTIRKEIEIAAPIEIAFEAVLDELGAGAQMPGGKSLSMKIEPWPGGRWFRDLGNNAGHLWGHVQVIKPPTLLEITAPMPMSYPAVNHVQYRLKANGDGTLLNFAHRAMGLILPEHRDGMPEGWTQWINQIRERAEQKARGYRAVRSGSRRIAGSEKATRIPVMSWTLPADACTWASIWETKLAASRKATACHERPAAAHSDLPGRSGAAFADVRKICFGSSDFA